MKVTLVAEPTFSIEASAKELRYLRFAVGQFSAFDDREAGFDDDFANEVFRVLVEAVRMIDR